jgi:hypothetical protein
MNRTELGTMPHDSRITVLKGRTLLFSPACDSILPSSHGSTMAECHTANIATASPTTDDSETTSTINLIDYLDTQNPILSTIQAKEVKQFCKDLKLSGTDSEKYLLCIRKRNHLLDRYTRLEILTTALEGVMSAECEEYNDRKRKTKRATPDPLERAENAESEQWESFAGVASKGSLAISQILARVQYTPPGVHGMSRTSEVGPYKCEWTNTATGRTCDATFSRPYDLTRHEENVHNPKRQRFSCTLCTKAKSLSRSDALVRHMRMVHGINVPRDKWNH